MHIARILANDGFTQIQIAEKLGVSDRMVRKYLNPNYSPKARQPRPSKLDPYKAFITNIIEDEPYFNVEVLASQLRSQGYQGAMTILRQYAASVRDQAITKAVLRFETIPGKQAQVDWKECGTMFIDGRQQKVYAFVMLLGYSRRAYVHFTTSMRSPVLLACHNKAFAYFNGIPAEVLYDNMKTAWLSDSEGWKVNPALLEYASQVGFVPKRCKVRRPQTKGKVERFISYLSGNFLAQQNKDESGSLEELNEAVLQWLKEVDQKTLEDFGMSRTQRFEQEEDALIPWISSGAPVIRESVPLVVSREGTVTYKTNRYSVPAQHIGKTVTLGIEPLDNRATLSFDGTKLYQFTLALPGEKKRLIRPEDEKSLRDRWQQENQGPQRGKRMPPRPKRRLTRELEVVVRTPASYDALLEYA